MCQQKCLGFRGRSCYFGLYEGRKLYRSGRFSDGLHCDVSFRHQGSFGMLPAYSYAHSELRLDGIAGRRLQQRHPRLEKGSDGGCKWREASREGLGGRRVGIGRDIKGVGSLCRHYRTKKGSADLGLSAQKEIHRLIAISLRVSG